MSERAKQTAGRYAADRVEDGMTIGLGTGSTAAWVIRRLGERVRQGLRVTAVPTSRETERLARRCGIALTSLDDSMVLDVTIDGADQVGLRGSLIKGGGGALLREKVVAHRSRILCVVVDPSKLVTSLGGWFRLPVEVVPFAWQAVCGEVRRRGGMPELRLADGGEPFVTDNKNWILDVAFPHGIRRPAELERSLDEIPGLVESGLFVGLTDCVIVGYPEEAVEHVLSGRRILRGDSESSWR